MMVIADRRYTHTRAGRIDNTDRDTHGLRQIIRLIDSFHVAGRLIGFQVGDNAFIGCTMGLKVHGINFYSVYILQRKHTEIWVLVTRSKIPTLSADDRWESNLS